MKCLIDLDGVLVDFVTGICAAHGSSNVYDDPANHGKYEMEVLLGLSATQFWKPANEQFWADLPITDDFHALLGIVESAFGAENVCLLTSPIANEGCTTGKVRWIYKHLPDYKRRFLIGPVKHFCAHERSVLVDDYDKNVNNFREHGGKAVLVPRPWNSMHATKDAAGYVQWCMEGMAP